MTPLITDPTQCPTWDDKIREFAHYSVFHSTAWAKTLVGSYQYTPLYFSMFSKKDLAAALPVMEIKSSITGYRGVSLPFTDHCSPLIRNAADFKDLFQDAVQCGQKAKWKYIELRDDGNLFSEAKPHCFYYAHTLELRVGEQRIFSKLRGSTRRNIKKAVKKGVRIQISNSLAALKGFYKLNTITRKKHGLPPQPFRFFHNIYKYLISQGQGFIAMAIYRQQPIAGAVYLYFGKSAVFKYGASDPRFLFLRPNNLVMWEAIRWFIHKGFQSISFGRTEPENEGLIQFKRGWGADENRINYFKFDLKTNAFVEGKSNSKSSYGIFRLMPAPLLRVLGTLMYKHVG